MGSWDEARALSPSKYSSSVLSHFFHGLPDKIAFGSGVPGVFKKKVLKTPGLNDPPAASRAVTC